MRELWNHQKEALRRARLLPADKPQEAGFGLFFEPGAGKTATAIHRLRELINGHQRFFRTLVFCPPIVVPNWKDEFLLNSKIEPHQIQLLKGPGEKRLKKFTEGKAQIYITNYESLLMKPLYAAMKKWQPEAIIFDESHQLKTYNAKRSKLAERLANEGPIIPYKQILSGTPMLKDPMDLFHQFLILDGGRTFGSNFFVFRALYFVDRNAGMPKDRYFPKWEPKTLRRDGFDGEGAIAKRLERVAMSVKKADCLDLPPLVQKTILVEMAPEQKRIYEEMKRDFLTYYRDKACVATMAVTKMLRLLQISSGYVKDSEGTEHELDETPKEEALVSLLEDIIPSGHKVLVWATWKNNYKTIRKVFERLGIQYAEITGEVTATQRDAAVVRFNSDPNCRAILGHPGAGGIGINLVSAAYSIFYSRTASLAHSVQAEARNYRGGSEIHDKITRYDIVCEGTIEEVVCKKLAEKIELSDRLLSDIAYELEKQ